MSSFLMFSSLLSIFSNSIFSCFFGGIKQSVLLSAVTGGMTNARSKQRMRRELEATKARMLSTCGLDSDYISFSFKGPRASAESSDAGATHRGWELVWAQARSHITTEAAGGDGVAMLPMECVCFSSGAHELGAAASFESDWLSPSDFLFKPVLTS